MPTTKLKLVTIISETILEDRIIRELKQLGVRGYTVSGEVRGEGTRGLPTVDFGGQNIRIETLVNPELATQIMAYIAEHYFADYAVIVYTLDAEVIRSEKYL
ncbi:MAG: transcriptional regulator [Candidatus Viridilinea halotolerans]|uniref:Transcriptional regulator n=1 Tax=Candidatus Viridilinea halotolerans TaxID=2491704 RepID=A0A426TXV6_9CHLR|nr:MAG: transcriptional regulator [Candidatus Viridilinea halotolerans]